MSKHLERGNMLWEGSRMMLPEHKLMINQRKEQQKLAEKPELDEQYLVEIAETIQAAQHERYTVTVRIFDEFEEIVLTGRLIRVDQQARRLWIDTEEGPHPVPIDDILSIEKAR